jgi:hypothetical protein
MGDQGYAGRARLGDIADVELDSVKSPVTGVVSPFTILLGNGFLTNRMDTGTTTRFSLNHPDLNYEHNGKFSTTFKIDWKGEG